MSFVLFKILPKTILLHIIYIFNIFMEKQDLAVNELQGLICHKIQPTNQPTNLALSLSVYVYIYIYMCVCVCVCVCMCVCVCVCITFSISLYPSSIDTFYYYFISSKYK